MARRRLRVAEERWPLAEVFAISRGAKREARVVTATIAEGAAVGRGECVPYPRYGESVAGVKAQIEGLEDRIAAGINRDDLQGELPAGAARNALDCALWDLDAKLSGQRVFELAGLDPPVETITAVTLSLASPAAMGKAAARRASCPLLKVKVGAEQVIERLTAVRANAPEAELIVDANEAWDLEQLRTLLPELRALDVAMVEQPLPAGGDGALPATERPVLCADESVHEPGDLASAAGYPIVNIKLDKSGGLTAALELRERAVAQGLDYMIGSMVSTSLGVAPALLLARGARYVDLDGPLLLARDRAPSMADGEFQLTPPAAALWG